MEQKALELWRKWFSWSGNPWVLEGDEFDRECFFCGRKEPDHEQDCTYIGAKNLVEAHEQESQQS